MKGTNAMTRRLRKLLRDETGGVTEWVAITGGCVALALVIGTAFSGVGTALFGSFRSDVNQVMQNVATAPK